MAVESSTEKLSQANFTPEQSTRAICLLLIGSLTIQLNELACVLTTACIGEKQYFDLCTCALS